MNIRVKVGDQYFDVKVGDLSSRPVMAEVDGEMFEIWPEENGAAPVEIVKVPIETAAQESAMAPKPVSANCDDARVVLAPIPGVIISISVKIGDTVKPGQELCMLEAMKMKNPIRAVRHGKIEDIIVNVGDHVKHGQLLLAFTD